MSIGIDIIEISRIRRVVDRNRFFLTCVFSDDEIEQIMSKKSLYASIASRFCAKESFFKCIGRGINDLKDLKKVKILNLENGKPGIFLHEELNNHYRDYCFDLSMSHCEEYACAVVQKYKS